MFRFVFVFFVCVVFVLENSFKYLNAAPQPEKVAQVVAGTLKEAKVSWWGFDAEDSTSFLQTAIDSKVPRLIVDRQPASWITGTLLLRSDLELVFEEGTELLAKKGLFQGLGEPLLAVSNAKNVKIIGLGNGATLRMRKADYHSDSYKKSEWRHGINLRSVENVVIENLSIIASGGDGIYLGVATRGVPCRNVTIKKVVCDDNNRQGISVISADRLLIEDCVLKNTWGTPPAAGIDFEPNRPDEQLTDCIMRRCRIENNFGDGIEFYLGNLLRSTIPISVRLEQCVVLSGKHYGFNFITHDTPELTVKGHCELIDCRFENCESGGIAIVQKSAKGVAVTMKNTEIVHCGKEPETAPIRFRTNELDDFGGIDLGTIQITDHQKRLPVKLTDISTLPKQITGQLQLKRNNQTENLTINDSWLTQNYPNHLRAIQRVKPDTKDFVPLFVPLETKLSETDSRLPDSRLPVIWLRKSGTFWIYAEKGTPIRLTLAVRRIGNSELAPCSGTFTLPNGKTEKFKIPVESVQNFEYKTNSVAETGVYILQTDVGNHAVRLVQCNQPIVFPANPYLNLIASSCRFYFSVPAESKEFGIRIRGSENEAVKASVVNPAGQTVWTRDNINETVQFDQIRVDGNTGNDNNNNNNIAGIWQIVLERPSRFVFEDFGVTLLGIPPILYAQKPTFSANNSLFTDGNRN
ncbi:MAG: right-handed parallel beta-helix repeat-containing protein [Planctomycetaceae bacterium]|jgi:hypothetical protein|nr:right-handed parallel beta-helix repeat-containing protein [Planctomycetaceae bacterium]